MKDEEEKRFNLVMPMEMYGAIHEIAKDHKLSVTSLLLRFSKLGIMASDVSREPDGAIIFRKGDKERKVILFPEDHDDQDTVYLR